MCQHLCKVSSIFCTFDPGMSHFVSCRVLFSRTDGLPCVRSGVGGSELHEPHALPGGLRQAAQGQQEGAGPGAGQSDQPSGGEALDRPEDHSIRLGDI